MVCSSSVDVDDVVAWMWIVQVVWVWMMWVV